MQKGYDKILRESSNRVLGEFLGFGKKKGPNQEEQTKCFLSCVMTIKSKTRAQGKEADSNKVNEFCKRKCFG